LTSHYMRTAATSSILPAAPVRLIHVDRVG